MAPWVWKRKYPAPNSITIVCVVLKVKGKMCIRDSRQGVGLGCQHTAARGIVDGHISGALDGFRRGQLAEAFKHALIGERLDFFLGRIGSGQGSHKLVAGREAEHFSHEVRMKACLLYTSRCV